MQEQTICGELGMLNNLFKRQMACQSGEEFSQVTGMQGMIIHYLMVADGDRFQKMCAGISEADLATWFRVCGRIRANLEDYQRRASEGQE